MVASCVRAPTEIIARGIDWAISHNADVLSNSWGGGDPDPHIEDAINNGLTNGRNGCGAIFVFAAGNHGTSVEWRASLAKLLPVIAVSATKLAFWTHSGPTDPARILAENAL